MLSPLVLVPPTPSHPLLLYLSVSDIALGCMLAQLDDSGKEWVIYYLSKRMLDHEICHDWALLLGIGLGYSEIEILHDRVFNTLDISFRPFEIFVWQACSDWSTYEMVGTPDWVRYSLCHSEVYQREHCCGSLNLITNF